jgi:hypothetical protein
MIAAALAVSVIASSTTIAADVRARKSELGRLDHR